MTNETSLVTGTSTDLTALSSANETSTSAFVTSQDDRGSETVDMLFHNGVWGLGVGAMILNIAFLLVLHASKATTFKSYHPFIKNLSVANIFASFTFLLSMHGPSFPLNSFFPHSSVFVRTVGVPYILRGLPWLFLTAYFLNLTCLTLNHFLAVRFPITYSNHAKTTRHLRIIYVTIGVTWFVSMWQVLVPLIVVLRFDAEDDLELAHLRVFEFSVVELEVWMFVIFTSVVVSVLLNALVYARIRVTNVGNGRGSVESSARTTSASRVKQEASVTIRILLATTILMRLPFPLTTVAALELHDISFELYDIVNMTSIILLFANFFTDPIVYSVRMREARDVIYRLLRCFAQRFSRINNGEHNDVTCGTSRLQSNGDGHLMEMQQIENDKTKESTLSSKPLEEGAVALNGDTS